MKTELITRMLEEPVKFLGKRADTVPLSPISIEEESRIEPSSEYAEREAYVMRVVISAIFYRRPNENPPERLERYRALRHTIAQEIYGDVLREVRKLNYVTAKIDNREAREAIETVIRNVINMTRPEG